MAGLVTSSSPVPLKTRRVWQRCTLNLSRAETSSHWCGVVVRRGRRCQLRCRPRHSTMVQNYHIHRQKPLNSYCATLVFTHSLATEELPCSTCLICRGSNSSRWCGVVVRRGEWHNPGDRALKLCGSSPTVLVLLYSARL
ncbi:uncharacterized protein TNCV_3649201 [Trichonephila clavipes]|nr:uncharacterized protein TNCV_3649201 [Trichonephila clavipes]